MYVCTCVSIGCVSKRSRRPDWWTYWPAAVAFLRSPRSLWENFPCTLRQIPWAQSPPPPTATTTTKTHARMTSRKICFPVKMCEVILGPCWVRNTAERRDSPVARNGLYCLARERHADVTRGTRSMRPRVAVKPAVKFDNFFLSSSLSSSSASSHSGNSQMKILREINRVFQNKIPGFKSLLWFLLPIVQIMLWEG